MLWRSNLLPCLLVLAAGQVVWAVQPAEDAKQEQKITFDDHIKPIFREHCTACHSESDKTSDLALDTYSGALAGGSSGEVVAANNPSGSRLYALMTHAERPFMPPDEDAIAKPKLDLVKLWIDQGMPENSGSKIKRSTAAAAAMLGDVSLGKPEGPPPMPEKLLTEPVVVTERSAAIAAMAASPWAPLIAVGGQQQVVLYHAQSGDLLGVIPFPEGEPQSLTFTRDGKQLLIGGGRHSHSGCAVLVDIASGERIVKVGDELDIVLAADISPNKSRIAIAGPQKIVRVFDSVTGEKTAELKKHTDWIFTLRFSPDGILLASGDRSNGVIVWEAESGLVYAELAGHKDAVRGLDFRPDSNVLATASLDGQVKLWDLVESKEIKSWAAHGGGATAIAYANDGSIATAGRDSRIKFWDGTGNLQHEFIGLQEAALEVAVTGDAKYVAGGDWTGGIKLWQVADPEQVQLIAANPPSIETRLGAAESQFNDVEKQFAALELKANEANANSEQSQAKLAAAKQAQETTQASLTTAQATLDETTTQLQQKRELITSLEMQLANAKQAELQLSAQQKSLKAETVTLQEQATSQTRSAAEMQQRHEQLLALAATANEEFSLAQERLVAAKQELEKLRSEKQALEAKATDLKTAVAQATAGTKELAEALSSATLEQQNRQAEMQAMNSKLDALQKQLQLLQAKVEEARQAQNASRAELDSSAAKTNELKSALESAEQKALEAQQQLDLFQQAYEVH